MPERTPLPQLMAALGDDGQRVLAYSADAPVSRADFLHMVRAWQQAFAVQPGQRFALHLADSVAFAAALFGAWHAGKTITLPADTLPATMRSLALQVDGLAGDFAGALQPDYQNLPGHSEFAPLDSESTQLVLYTSGTSGDPVAIGKSLRQLDKEIAALEARFGNQCRDAVVHGTVSHQHIYGLLFRVLWPLSAGRVFASTRLGYPEQIVSAIAGGPAVLVTSPALLKRIPESLDWSGLRTRLRTVFCSGGPLGADAAETVSRLWQQSAVQVFGSTETGGIASRQACDQPWQPLPGVEFRFEEGLLQVRSPHLAQAEWFGTQDRAQPSGQGFELLGRADRLVKLEERRISLGAIERALLQGPWLQQVRVLMLSGSRSRIAAVAVPTSAGRELLQANGRKDLVDRLRASLRDDVDAIAIPRLWRFVDALPVDSQGKTTERLLAPLFQSLRPEPRWLERSASRARLALTAEPELAVFDGHFPKTPIVPGVALADWAIRWARDAFAIQARFLRMDAMKFQRLVAPGTELELSLDWQAAAGVLTFRFDSAQGPHASGRIVFEAEAVPA